MIVLVLGLTGAQAAQAEPKDLTGARSQAAALEARLRELKDQAETLREKYGSAAKQLAQTEADAAQNAALFIQAQKDYGRAQSALADRLAHIYKQGRSGALDLLLGSTSLPDLLYRIELLERISKHDADLLRQVTSYRAQLADQEERLTAQLEREQASAAQVEAARQAVVQKLAQTRELLKGKEAEIAQLEKEWRDQQAKELRLQQERQAKLQAALADAQASAQESGRNPGQEPAPKNDVVDAGGQAGDRRAPNILKPEQIALAARKAGFSGEDLVIAVAVAMSESGGDANAIGRLHTYGLWQILSSAHPDLIDPKDPDSSKWYDPFVNATFAWKISSHGTNWLPWSVYRSGAYERCLDKARAGVDLLLSSS